MVVVYWVGVCVLWRTVCVLMCVSDCVFECAWVFGCVCGCVFFFFNDSGTTEIYTILVVGSVRCV